MTELTIVFTKRRWNLGSWLIRWALPRSRFALAISSHCLIQDGDHYIEAQMMGGVKRTIDALKPQTVVKVVKFQVPDAAAGLAWARSQVGKPYDFAGAFGVALAPDRDWCEPDTWFCYELAAATMVNAGRDAFTERGHITEATLLSLNPCLSSIR